MIAPLEGVIAALTAENGATSGSSSVAGSAVWTLVSCLSCAGLPADRNFDFGDCWFLAFRINHTLIEQQLAVYQLLALSWIERHGDGSLRVTESGLAAMRGLPRDD